MSHFLTIISTSSICSCGVAPVGRTPRRRFKVSRSARAPRLLPGEGAGPGGAPPGGGRFKVSGGAGAPRLLRGEVPIQVGTQEDVWVALVVAHRDEHSPRGEFVDPPPLIFGLEGDVCLPGSP